MDQEIKEKLEAIWPEVIGVVITKRGEKVNLTPINYQAVSTVYEKPLSVCLGLSNTNYTLENILETKEFVYAYPSKEQLKQVLYCGTVSGRDTDKLANTDFTLTKSDNVAPPYLDGAVLSYECKLLHHYNVGEFTIVIGEILAIHASDKTSLDKMYALGGMRYGAIKEVETLQEGR
jgi:flavin reductase (DIM6/NTAB) family NADH-FMN oxidoreductase RutF